MALDISGLTVTVELSHQDRVRLDLIIQQQEDLMNLAQQEDAQLDAIETSLKVLGAEITDTLAQITTDQDNEVTQAQIDRLTAIGTALTSDAAALHSTAATSPTVPPTGSSTPPDSSTAPTTDTGTSTTPSDGTVIDTTSTPS